MIIDVSIIIFNYEHGVPIEENELLVGNLLSLTWVELCSLRASSITISCKICMMFYFSRIMQNDKKPTFAV